MDKKLHEIKSEILLIINDKAKYNKEVWNAVYDYFCKLEKEGKKG